MKKNLMIFVAVLFAVLAVPAAYGFVTHGSNYFSITDNTNYQMTGVIASGGNMLLSDAVNYKLSMVVGQPVIGHVEGGIYKMDLGFFFGGISQRMIPIMLSGTLTYGNGTAVANSEIKAVISYNATGESYEGSDVSDANGYFEITVYVPDYFMTYEFLLQLFVVGDVEAMYSCIYCPSTGYCTSSGCA